MNYTHISTEVLLETLLGPDGSVSYDGTLRPLFEADADNADDLAPLFAARELMRRWLAEELQRVDSFGSPQAVKDYLHLAFAGQTYETFVVLFFDAQQRMLEAEEMFRGTLSQTAVYPREVVKRALYWNAGAVIFAHNHPSGIAEPSRADEHLTQSLKTALSLIDVRVLDHFVIAGSAVTSFAERGLL